MAGWHFSVLVSSSCGPSKQRAVTSKPSLALALRKTSLASSEAS